MPASMSHDVSDFCFQSDEVILCKLLRALPRITEKSQGQTPTFYSIIKVTSWSRHLPILVAAPTLEGRHPDLGTYLGGTSSSLGTYFLKGVFGASGGDYGLAVHDN
eukprot:4024613-Amphidinium_carterae.1